MTVNPARYLVGGRMVAGPALTPRIARDML
jgi:hypothetical protein